MFDCGASDMQPAVLVFLAVDGEKASSVAVKAWIGLTVLQKFLSLHQL